MFPDRTMDLLPGMGVKMNGFPKLNHRPYKPVYAIQDKMSIKIAGQSMNFWTHFQSTMRLRSGIRSFLPFRVLFRFPSLLLLALFRRFF